MSFGKFAASHAIAVLRPATSHPHDRRVWYVEKGFPSVNMPLAWTFCTFQRLYYFDLILC
jgi:hypothetical protein